MVMNKEKAWVWFKGNLGNGYWMGGFIATSSPEGGIFIEKQDFVNCRVPEWIVSISEPIDKKAGPEIPEGAIWKHV